MALKKTHAQFRAALRYWDGNNPLVSRTYEGKKHRQLRRQAFAMWWFMENVNEEDPSRGPIYWEIREANSIGDTWVWE